MQQLEEKIKQVKTALDKARDLRYKAEARLEQLERQEEEILKELEELGVKPEHLEQEIENLENNIQQRIQEAWSLLPEELLKSKGNGDSHG
ncbi:hypothetical protein GXN76_08560 [Kroppenstedtia pulmonis]|uniref:Uncharacterized protein n=1 Tax=Kroppenstedtia pulmonis TaxID=1380685 RepID=A0A7D3XQR0_9BACL|nr:hypothetical protein [Kroppenstedtia pulmonis]QKG84522.1 hypothetical protein GXN76_08560 [Kroppenstedtia pulmonis]